MSSETAVNWYMATATARATLRALGATKIALRVCSGGSGGARIGVGLEAPVMESVELSPALLRTRSDGSREIVVDASTLEETLAATSENVIGILKNSRVSLDGVESMIAEVQCDQLGGAPYIYRLRLEA
jgi:hypothetical protein